MGTKSHATGRIQRRFATASVIALAACANVITVTAVQAQDSPAGQSASVDEVVVTGSRVIANGFKAPTPLTVVTQESIQQNTAGSNISTALLQMPAIAGSLTSQGNINSTNGGSTRVNALSLRGLGPTRTLLLVDGQRVVPSTLNGSSDLNSIPQQLVSRVDIVTGGAAAVYGSDAVAGVVNVILDHTFTGIKLDASGNITSHKDNPGYNLAASAGRPFAGGKGHVILSSEYAYQEGIDGDGGRDWNYVSRMQISNPAYTATSGQPQNLIRNNVQVATATFGGLVYTGPLQGLAFGPGGSTYQFQYGELFNRAASPTTNPYMVGGTPNQPRNRVMSLDNNEKRFNVLTRAQYDLTDNVTVFGQFSYAQTDLTSNNNLNNTPGNTATQGALGGPPLVRIDNPFLPASVVAAMRANNLTSIGIGTLNDGIPPIRANVFRQVNRITFGADGKYSLLGNDWKWNATYLYNNSKSRTYAQNVVHKARYLEAVDAVTNPATGATVCRSTLTAPNNGCVPYNVLGEGVASAAATRYVTGTPWQNLTQSQQVFDFNTGGTLFNNWAGPVTVSADFAYRTEKGDAVSNQYVPGSTTVTQWLFVNMGAEHGKYSVKEAAIETLFPLLADAGFVESWDLNAAARLTDYSTSGSVTTWKLGTSLQTAADVRLRASYSKDIRAPNINELYAVGVRSLSPLGFSDPLTGGNPSVTTVGGGNPLLTPEQAKQQTMGIVWQPSFIPGFTASVDYWAIRLKDIIAQLSTRNIVELCANSGQFCSQITRGAGNVITEVRTGQLNQATNTTRGLDFEVGYGFEPAAIWSSLPGRITLRGNLSHYLQAYQNSGVGTFQNNVGVIGQVPKWSGNASVAYRVNDAWTVSMTARGFSKYMLASGAIECTTGCPASTANNPTYDDAHTPSRVYLDGSLTYTLRNEGSQRWQAYVNVKNILDKDPPPMFINTYWTANTNTGVYDYLGRVYRAGVRMSF